MNPQKVGGSTIGGRDPSAAWLNPELVMYLAPVSVRYVTIPAGVVTQILNRNPRRVGLSVITNVADATPIFISPDSQPQTYGIPVPTATRIATVMVDDMLSEVGGPWYAYHAAGTTLRVSEFTRPA